MTKEKEKRPQVQMLEFLKNKMKRLGVDVNVTQHKITFSFHKGGRIQDVGQNGCTLADVIEIAKEAQRFYEQMFDNEDRTIFRSLDDAHRSRSRQELDAVINNSYDKKKA